MELKECLSDEKSKLCYEEVGFNIRIDLVSAYHKFEVL
jgi:hypothetical protein